MTSIFCHHINYNDILYQTEHFKVVRDIAPFQTRHLLTIGKEHYDTLDKVPPVVRYELFDLEVFLTEKLCQALAVDSVTIAFNERLFDASTHFHVHLIPILQEDGFWDQISLTQVQLDLYRFLKAL